MKNDVKLPPVLPDLEVISAHLWALFPPAFVHKFPDAQVEIAYGSPSTGPRSARLFSAFSLDEAADFAYRRSEQGENIYVGVALRSGTANSQKRAGKADVLASHLGWTDFDGSGDLTRVQTALVKLGIRPSVVVVTGEVPHDRFHLYFPLAGTLTVAQLEQANAALHACLGGDPVGNADRILRLAGTVNYPSEGKSSKGYTVELVTLELKTGVEPYNLGHLEALAGKAAPALSTSDDEPSNPYLAYGAEAAGRDDEALLELLERSRVDGQWHFSMLAAVASMLGRGWSEAAIRMACAPYCRGGYGDPDLAPMINGGQANGRGDAGFPGDRIAAEARSPQQPPQLQQPPKPLAWADMAAWDHVEVPVRQWAIPDRVPLNQAGLFSGEGGTGKSIIELMKNVCHVASQVVQRDWMGALPDPGPAFYIGAEDDLDELHIRLAAIAEHYGMTFTELTDLGLHVLPLLGEDAVLCRPTRGGSIETTPLYRQILEAAGDIKPRNISIDTLSRAFAGNEIDRGQVYGFAMHMQHLAKTAGGSVTVLSHPSLAGLATGSGLSGSTAWHGAFRFRQYLSSIKAADEEEGQQDQPKTNLRQLEFKKNQYGPLAASLILEYREGLFLPVVGQSAMERIAQADIAKRVFLAVLKRLLAAGVYLSHKISARNYAPTIIAREKEAKLVGIRKADLVVAMRDLFEGKLLQNVEYGAPSKRAERLEPR